jgi:cytochrome P450
MSALNHKTPSGPYSLLSADITHDPYPLYHAIRASSPVYFDSKLSRWLVTGYEAAVAVITDLRFSSKMAVQAFQADESAAQSPAARYFASTMFTNDPPAHARLRNLVNKAFTPRVLELLRARIQRLTDSLLDEVQPIGRMEVMRHLAQPLPLRVIVELLGVEVGMSDQLKHR